MCSAIDLSGDLAAGTSSSKETNGFLGANLVSVCVCDWREKVSQGIWSVLQLQCSMQWGVTWSIKSYYRGHLVALPSVSTTWVRRSAPLEYVDQHPLSTPVSLINLSISCLCQNLLNNNEYVSYFSTSWLYRHLFATQAYFEYTSTSSVHWHQQNRQ